MASSNYISKVAIVGAGGNSGSYMTKELLKTGKHNVTAITREDSQSALPEGVQVKKVDYGKQETLVEALKGQDALVITMNPRAHDNPQQKLIEAAGEAGVQWILPNDWAPDTENEGLQKDVSVFATVAGTRKAVEAVGKSSYISVATGFWYEWSLAIPAAYGFDFEKKSVTLFDDGNTKISQSTWPQVGRAVAALLSLPVKPEGEDKSHSLEHFRNKMCYVSSFAASQNDMLESVLRVTQTKREDWNITKEPSKERYMAGVKELSAGDFTGFVKIMYARVFYPDGSGDFDASRGTANAILGLPKEDIDEATKAAIERAKNVKW